MFLFFWYGSNTDLTKFLKFLQKVDILDKFQTDQSDDVYFKNTL
jgi:hypothetical protein